MTRRIWQSEDEAPEGWARVDLGEHGRSTWLTDTYETVLVPVYAETCDECGGEGYVEDDAEPPEADEWRRCPDCNGDGYVDGSEVYDFEHAVSKVVALKVEKLRASGVDISEWEWWAEKGQA